MASRIASAMLLHKRVHASLHKETKQRGGFGALAGRIDIVYRTALDVKH